MTLHDDPSKVVSQIFNSLALSCCFNHFPIPPRHGPFALFRLIYFLFSKACRTVVSLQPHIHSSSNILNPSFCQAQFFLSIKTKFFLEPWNQTIHFFSGLEQQLLSVAFILQSPCDLSCIVVFYCHIMIRLSCLSFFSRLQCLYWWPSMFTLEGPWYFAQSTCLVIV